MTDRLRALRATGLAGQTFTQQMLADALAQESPISLPTLASWENLRAPKKPPAERLWALARLYATERSWDPDTGTLRLLAEDELTDQERQRAHDLRAEFQRLRIQGTGLAAEARVTAVTAEARRTWSFEHGPIYIIAPDVRESDIDAPSSPLIRPSHPNYIELLSYADLDGLMELHGHIRAENPEHDVYRRIASNVEVDALTSHLVLLGGLAWNDLASEMLDRTPIPIRQVKDSRIPSGEIFESTDRSFTPFLPVFENNDAGTPEKPGVLREDVALLARVPHPYNSSRTLTICNGVHSRGVLGAVRCLTDQRFRGANERYLAERFPEGAFALLLRVAVVKGEALTPDLQNEKTRLFEWPAKDAS